MKCIRHLFVVFVFTLCWLSPAYAQFSSDLGNDIYHDITIWEGRGYISQLPIIRPYPETVLVEIVKEVMRKGDFLAKEKAQRYFDELSRFLITADVYTNHYLNIVSENNNSLPLRWYGSGGVEGRMASFVGTPLVSMSAAVGFKVVADKDSQSNAEIRNYFFESENLMRREEIPDDFKITTLRSIELRGASNARTSFAAGTPDAYLHTGLMRRSIGPFFDDGLIVSSRAPQTGNLVVRWKVDKVAITWALFMLTSKQEYKKFNSISDNEPSYSYRFNKVYFYNSISWYINPNIEFNVWESVMFGDFNFAYLLPIKLIYAIDSLGSFVAGNLFLGISLDFRIGRTVKLPFVLLIDDVNVNDVIRFKWDTKIKIALQTGVTWTPTNSIFKRFNFDYQLVLPYTYSHSQTGHSLYSTEYNTTNHTVHGENFGTTLKPSSHRINLEALISPIRYLDLSLGLRFIQHNNASAGILNGPKNDGSTLDDGYYSVYDGEDKEGPSFQNRNGFLNGLIEHTFETGVNLSTEIPLTSRINIYGDVSYTLRYILNYNLIENLNRLENVVMFTIGGTAVIN